MKSFRGFVIKEFYHIFRDYRTILIMFLMPIIQVLLFGFAITNEIKDAKIAILDNSNDYMTQKLTQKILSSGYFILYNKLNNYKEIEPEFRKGNIKEVIIFESNFAKNIERNKAANIQIIADASDYNMANILTNYTISIINDFKLQQIKDKPPLQIQPEIRMFYNPQLKGVYMFIPGTMVIILMLISAMVTSISIAREKELGTMEVLLVSPLKPIIIIIGKVIPYILVSFINALIVIMLGYFVFGMPIMGSLTLLLAECMLFLIMSLSLGILISTVSNSQQTAMLISMFVLMLPTILLSGFIFPIENMPMILQVISSVMPPRWFIIILKGIMIKGVGLEYLWKETLIILGMTIFFIALSVKKFKIRLE